MWGDMYIPLTMKVDRVIYMIRNHEDLMKADGRCAFAVFDFCGGEFISTKGKPWLVAAAKKQEVTQ